MAAGYWPEGTPRYLGVPSQSLDDALVVRPARRRAQHPALVAEGYAVTYAELATDVEAVAANLRSVLHPDADRVAVACASPRELLSTFLGAVRARARTTLVDLRVSHNDLSTLLEGSSPDLMIADDGARSAVRDVRMTSASSAAALRTTSTGPQAEAKRFDPKSAAVGLAEPEGGVVYHSNMSLLAWAVSWSAFLSLTEKDTYMTLQRPQTWPGVTAVVASLFRGSTCVFSDARSPSSLSVELDLYKPALVSMSFAQAEELARDHDMLLREAFVRNVRAVVVAIEGRFEVMARRRIEQALGVPVLTVLGTPATGPVIAAHPSWYLDEAAGLPVTNVDVWPLRPGTSDPLAVSWEAIDCAEIGMRSPMVATCRGGDDSAPLLQASGWYGLGIVGLTDPTGLFYLRPWR